MEAGVYDNIPADDYHGGAGINVSTLKMLAEEGGPARVRWGHPKESKALRFGSLIHVAVLEPQNLAKAYYPVALDRFDTRSQGYRAAEIQAAGREIVRASDYEAAQRIRDAVMSHPVARDLLAPGYLTEQSFYWTDRETGELCRGRADGARPDMKVLFDLKSTIRATRDAFSRSVSDWFYDWQNAWYVDGWARAAGWEPQAFIFLAVEKEPPYLTGAYEIEAHDIDKARDEVRAQLRRYVRFRAEDRWSGLPQTLETIELPAWRRRTIMEDDQ